ncbi:MAG: aspartate--ammonia ligase [Calditrichia bacterium]
MEKRLIIPENYKDLLDIKETEKGIRLIKEFFQINLSFELNLTRVTAPLYVIAGEGINDDLNGVEKPVSFKVKDMDNAQTEIVLSLAKWKRMKLADYSFKYGEGLYTDMNAIRPDEVLDNIHSLYVDQWDWERVISGEERNVDFLKKIVRQIYDVIRRTEKYTCQHYPVIEPILNEEITFFHSEDLEEMYPELTPKEREKEVCKEYGSVFVIGIGADLKNGNPHDDRAPDYDDWSTPVGEGKKGLNGDILIYYPLLDCAYELSSMGIRVDKEALKKQLEIKDCPERKDLYFHKRLLNNELPLSIGGGIGQSRLCMFYLRKAHIGEIQASIWPEKMIKECYENDILIL